MVFWIGSVMQFIAIIICFIFNEEKFDYKKKSKTPEIDVNQAMINQ